jgi:hypothetical protein
MKFKENSERPAVEKRAFYCCDSLTEVLWAEGSEIEVIEEEAFEDTQLNKLELPGSLEYIGARMCPARTELLLTKQSANRRLQKWKAEFLQNRYHVLGTRKRKEGESESGTPCAVM